MKKFLVIAALLVVLVGTAAAEGLHPYGMAGLFRTWRANTIKQFGIGIGLHFDVWAFRRDFAGSGYEYADQSPDDPIDEIWTRNPFQLSLCFLDAWELSVAPSFGGHKVFNTDIEVFGLTELFIGNKVNFITEEGYLPSMALLLNLDLGVDGLNTRYPFEPRGLEKDTSLDIIYALSKYVGPDNIFSYALNLGYRISMGQMQAYEYIFDENTGRRERTSTTVNAPDYFIYSAGFEIQATKNFSFITELSGRVSFGDDITRYGRTEKFSDNWLQITPGFRLSGDDFLYWDFAVPIGVGSDNPWIGVMTGFSAHIAFSKAPPLDSDGDGIPDHLDLCPFTYGYAEWYGCPNPDSDGDGVCDPWVSEMGLLDEFAHICTGVDLCPDVPGYPEWFGCPNPDRDGDGVCDPWVSEKGLSDEFAHICVGIDLCPDVPGVLPDGCPEEIIYEGPRVIRLDGINFEPNSAVMRPGYRASLDEAARILKEYPTLTVTISGHTTDRGEAGFLRRLSEERAQAVVNVLVNEYGIARQRLRAIGHGPDKPVASNATASGREENRRIEFEVDN